jgi:hypothetical protein
MMRKRRGGVPPPKIITTTRRDGTGAEVARPAAVPFPLVVSHPVPPLREQPRALGAVAVPEMSLTADRTRYVVAQNEFPSYSINGADPNEPILWSLWQNGLKVVDDQTFDKATDNAGNWFGVGSPWLAVHAGFWVVLARTGERQASVRFIVTTDLDELSVPPDSMLGVTHVAGLYRFATPDSELVPTSFLVEGARHVLNLGARHLFAYLTPQYRSDYSFDDFGGAAYTSLTALARSPEYRDLFDLPFETFVLTVYTFANWAWIVSRGGEDAIAFDAEGERKELADLVAHLTATYPGKHFVLKNWEGDWQMKLSFDPDAIASDQQVAEVTEWLRARQDGIAQGSRDSNGPRVQHAVEMNLIHHAQRGLPSMLASVIPHVDSDLIAYASWWSIGRAGDRSRNVRDDISFIRGFPGVGSRSVIVSEFGISHQDRDLGPRTKEMVQTLSSAGVPMAFYWEIFDNGPNLALVGPEATRFDSWHTIRAFLGARNDASLVHEQTRLPEEVVTGQEYPASVTVRNEGNMFDPVLGYALGLLDPDARLAQVIWVRREVRTGEVVTLEFTLRAPATAGVYTFRMFQHGVELFGEARPIRVTADGGSIAGDD